MQQDNSLTLVMPAYNEEETLGRTLPRVLEHCEARGWKLIVVNDGSRDNTRQVLEAHKHPLLRALHHKVNRGYGGALKTGIRAADTRYIVTIDADGQHAPEMVDDLLRVREEQGADMVVGRRASGDEYNAYRELGKWIIRMISRLLVPHNIHDINSGLKLYDARAVKRYIRLCPDGMSFSDIITLVFIQQRHLVVECPIHIRKRAGGKSTITIRAAIETVSEIVNVIMLFNPMRLFFPLFVLFVTTGALWAIPFLLKRRGLSTASMFMAIAGLIFLVLGLVTEQLALIRRETVGNPEDFYSGEEPTGSADSCSLEVSYDDPKGVEQPSRG